MWKEDSERHHDYNYLNFMLFKIIFELIITDVSYKEINTRAGRLVARSNIHFSIIKSFQISIRFISRC